VNPGDVVLISLPQAGGGPPKLRPALVLAQLPGSYQDTFICGVSTQLSAQIPDWDELIQPGDADYAQSGLHHASIIRLSYLYSTEQSEVVGKIGQIADDRLQRLQSRLADHISP